MTMSLTNSWAHAARHETSPVLESTLSTEKARQTPGADAEEAAQSPASKGRHHATHGCYGAVPGLGPGQRKPWEDTAGVAVPLQTWEVNRDSPEAAHDPYWVRSRMAPKAAGSLQPSPMAEGKRSDGRNEARSNKRWS